MKNLTIRNVSPELAAALEREKRRRGESLNDAVLGLLAQGLGVGGPRSNGLARQAGTWSEEELQSFEASVAAFESVDDELWR